MKKPAVKEKPQEKIERDKNTVFKGNIFWLIYLAIFGGIAVGLLLSKN